MNDLQVFENSDFGSIRTIEEDGKILFCGLDIAKALGYAVPRKALYDHCKGVLKRNLPTNGGIQEMSFLPEGDVYRLISHSQLPAAEKFESWIFDEVLPSIRRTGSYTMPNIPTDTMATANEAAKILAPIFDRAGMPAPFQALAMKQIYRKAGIELPVESLKAERELYDTGTIAKKAGVYALSGKPHVQAVGCILRNLEIPDSEKELVSFEKNGHMGTTYQYTAKVAELVKGWVKAQGFPEVIASSDGTRQFKVSYEN